MAFKITGLLLTWIITVVAIFPVVISAPTVHNNPNLFAMNIFKTTFAQNADQNIVISPACLEACLALAYFGAAGKTAEEIRGVLNLATNDTTAIGQYYKEFMQSSVRGRTDFPALKIVNRIYANENLEIQREFNDIASNYFRAAVERVRFVDALNTVNRINNWVEQQTEYKIKNLLRSDEVNGSTITLLINAIYFKGKWANPFTNFTTHKRNFSLNANKAVPVDMMYNGDNFKYADLPHLDAKVLEMAYNNSDMSMLLLLPNSVTGLRELEEQLTAVNFNDIISKMKLESVDLSLPRFRIEFSMQFKEILKQLGMKTMFDDDANFSKLFKFNKLSKVTDVKQKAFIDVNEAGSEAAAANFVKFYYKSFNPDQKVFRADHPFVFVIRSPKMIYFFGHIVKF